MTMNLSIHGLHACTCRYVQRLYHISFIIPTTNTNERTHLSKDTYLPPIHTSTVIFYIFIRKIVISAFQVGWNILSTDLAEPRGKSWDIFFFLERMIDL